MKNPSLNKNLNFQLLKFIKEIIFIKIDFKILRLILLSAIFELLISFSFQNLNFQTESIGIENNGDNTLLIWNPQSGSKYQLEQAEKDAIYSILYAGFTINNGNINQPSLLSNEEERQNFEVIKKQFFSKNGPWKTFTLKSNITSAIPNKIGDKKWNVFQITVSKTSLKNYLEEIKIIKKLNSGF